MLLIVGWHVYPATFMCISQSQDLDFQYQLYLATYMCLSQSQDLGFQRLMFVVFFVFSELRREVIVRFVDISGIVDHQCSNLLFIITYKYVKIIMLSRFIKQKSSMFLRCQILQLMNTLIITTVYWRLEGRRKQINNQMTAMWPFWQSDQVKQILMYELWDWYVILLKPCGVKLFRKEMMCICILANN